MKSLKYDFFGLNKNNALTVYNSTLATIPSKKVTTLTGYNSTFDTQSVKILDDINSIPIGVTYTPIESNKRGEVIRLGIISGVDTSLTSLNDPVYFNTTGDLVFSPSSQIIGHVIEVGFLGRIFLNISDASSSKIISRKIFTGDGVTTMFDLQFTPKSVNDVIVFIGSDIQTNYTFSGTFIEFTIPPINLEKIVIYRLQ